jgi:hypothetical protein
MTDVDVNRALGRLEGQLEGIVATLKRVDERSAARDGTWEEMVDRLVALEAQAKTMVIVTQEFNALQQAIRDGTNQAKGISKGFGLGIAFAAAGTGAAVAGLGKELWKLIFG